MIIENTVIIPTPPDSDASFYELTEPILSLSSTEDKQTAEISLGTYTNLEWTAGTAPSEIKNAASWGTKTLPGAGAFYFTNNQDGTNTIGHLDS